MKNKFENVWDMLESDKQQVASDQIFLLLSYALRFHR